MSDQSPQKKTSPWVYVGVGCLVAVVLVVGGVVLAGYMAFRSARTWAEDMTDPKARTAKVKKMLGAHELPAGYSPAMALSLGPLMEMAMLSDKAPDKRGMIKGFDERGFLYMRLPQSEDNQNLRDFMDGKRDDPGLQGRRMNVQSREVIGRGSFPTNGETVHYVAQRGEFKTDQLTHRGINTMMLLDCPTGGKTRIAFWFGPDPDPAKPVKELELAGTPADETALRAFMAYFKPCEDS